MSESVKIIECPRDAWQGLPKIIPTHEKAAYLIALVHAGFRHIDAVSFVSPKHVTQMADSEDVMRSLGASVTAEGAPEIIGIVVNEHGMDRALEIPGVHTLGYPYSISAYFRRANANMTRAESRAVVETLRKKTKVEGRDLVIYISMAFGNPYDEPWGPELIEDTLIWLKDIGVRSVSLADTAGTATAEQVGAVFRRQRNMSPESSWACICTAGAKALPTRCWRPMKPGAGGSMARSPDSAGARLQGTIWSGIYRLKL